MAWSSFVLSGNDTNDPSKQQRSANLSPEVNSNSSSGNEYNDGEDKYLYSYPNMISNLNHSEKMGSTNYEIASYATRAVAMTVGGEAIDNYANNKGTTKATHM